MIRSGNGISHSEEIGEKSEIFQIWFDPNISKTLLNDASLRRVFEILGSNQI